VLTNTHDASRCARASVRVHSSQSLFTLALTFLNLSNAYDPRGCFAGNGAACSYASWRCAHNYQCASCLDKLNGANAGDDVFAAYTSPACYGALHSGFGAKDSLTYLNFVFSQCSNVGNCPRVVTSCLSSGYGIDACLSCLNTTAVEAMTESEYASLSHLLHSVVSRSNLFHSVPLVVSHTTAVEDMTESEYAVPTPFVNSD
jgi:hypothetical protein